jgi:hypothetical protein
VAKSNRSNTSDKNHISAGDNDKMAASTGMAAYGPTKEVKSNIANAGNEH